jgi:outer membrane murein-binding lipoprotein Lpp
MNKKNLMILLTVVLGTILLSACGSSSVQNDANSSNKDTIAEEDTNHRDESNENNDNEGSHNNSNDKVSEENKSADSSKGQESDALSGYSAQEIEYARVWLQIVGNTDIKELNVVHISAGEQVNPYDDDSVTYPEDVISLDGKIMANGVVTYSGNGDGTINVYNVPSHWPSYEQLDKSMEEYTNDIINKTKQIYIEPRDDEEIRKLIEKIEHKNNGNQGSEIETDTPEKDQKKAISLVRDYLRNTYDDFVEDEDHFLAYDGEINGQVIVRYATLVSGHTSTNGRYAVDLTSGEVKDFTGDPHIID